MAQDVCAALGITNNRDALSHLDDDEKGVVIADTLGGKQRMTTVSESGLYLLILRSRKPEAKVFRRWVTQEVLPSIARTGGYIMTKPDDTPEVIMARAVLIAKRLVSYQRIVYYIQA